MKIALSGAGGRMGRAIMSLLTEERMTLVGAIEGKGHPALGRDAGEIAGVGHLGVEITLDASGALLGADCVIDFSSKDGLSKIATLAAMKGVPLVSGTTGLDASAERHLDEASKKIPVLWAPNTSVGVHVIGELVRLAVAMLGEDFDVEITETHHRRKVDAPSGTAKRLEEAVRAAREGLTTVTGRDGKPGARGRDELGVLALRGGDVVGDHSVHFLGDGERLEITHRATSREVFARGALRAARAISKRPPGRYTMADVMALSSGAQSAESAPAKAPPARDVS